ncbi:MAG TPA: DUF3560 domain-containing protein, partial [Niabella sp.]|nr:DUF3560 domain-containing protein [Niabella sp.]
MKHNFDERKQNRINYAKEQAEKNQQKGDTLYNQAKEMASFIPFGQPILVGHHSEKRDRNYRNKIHNTYGKAFEAMDKAQHYEQKAETIADNNAIFSDDSEALDKLKQKLAALQASQEFMKAANKCIRKKDQDGFLKIPHATQELWEKLNNPNVLGYIGYAGYKLQNNNANISRIKNRIALLEKMTAKPTTEIEINGVKVVQNAEANRVQLFFSSIPSEEIRKKL